MGKYADHVARGAALLDRLVPDWASKIQDEELAMESCHDCILGQVFGDYMKGCLRLSSDLPREFLFHASEHGFTVPEVDQDLLVETPEVILPRFAELADEWRKAIRERVDA